jgi:type I restriction enzyme R subunit
VIHTYDIKQAQEDKATVPIFYAPRQIKLHLKRSDIDQALEEITAGQVVDELERRKSQWAALAEAAGARDRLDDRFLQTFKDRPQENLRLKLLEKLVRDEIQLRKKKNLARAKSFQELLESTLQRYHNRLLDAAAVVRALLAIHRDMESDDQRARELNLDAEEVAFYDAVAAHHGNLYEPSFLRDLIHDVVQTIKKNLKVDWTEPHREDVKAAVRSAVKRVLRKRRVREDHFEVFLERIMEQAEAIYALWPRAA